MAQNGFREVCVLYYSQEDLCWIAHGLRTDQIGTGDCLIDALADAIRAIDQILAVAQREGDIEVLRPAPDDVQAKAKSAKQLPQELYEIAHRRARGTWPAEIKVEVPRDQRYTATIEEAVPA